MPVVEPGVAIGITIGVLFGIALIVYTAIAYALQA